jgi:hypothetical protein
MAVALKSCLTLMELKRLITHFTYRIEPKSEGGFIAHASDPTLAPLEAATREELQQKIQASIKAALAAEFPGLKLPLENKELNFAFHIEHKPDGGFTLHSTDGSGAPIEGATHAEIQSPFMEKFLDLLGKHLMPEVAQALAGQLGTGDIRVVVNRNVSFSSGTPKAAPFDAQQTLTTDSLHLDAKSTDLLNPSPSSPITPEPSSSWPIFRFLLVLLILAALMYFYYHR